MVPSINTSPLSGLAGQKGVRTTYEGYNNDYVQWTRCRDVVAGSDQVKSKGVLYLPLLSQQSVKDYNSYVMRANFYNATARTVSAMVGMIFRKPATIQVSDNVTNLLKNVDMAGTTFDVFSRKTVNEVIEVGRIGILIDYPQSQTNDDAPLTVANVQKMGLRPSMQTYTAENILNWDFTTLNNETVLSKVVLQEFVTIAEDQWTNKQKAQYRVLDLDNQNIYRVRIFQIDDKDGKDIQIGSDLYPVMNGQNLNYIPFMFICPDGTNADFDEPPILDLVDVNLSHYRTSADYEHGCHFTALPMLWVAGMNPLNEDGTPAQIYLGSQSALVLSNPDAKAGYIEFTGGGLSTLESNMDRKEGMMATLGAKMLAEEKKAPETAFTTAMSKVGENSILSSISLAVSLGLEKCLTWFSMWADATTNEADINYELNRDFLPVAIDGPTLTAYVQALQANALTQEELFDLFQRADLIEAEVTFEEHQTQAAKEKQEAADASKALMPQIDPATGQPKLITEAPSNPGLENPKNKSTGA